MKCEICNKEFKSFIKRSSIGRHLQNAHKLKGKEIIDYYDKYLKKEEEGTCQYCNQGAVFINTNVGYRKTCKNKECIRKYRNYIYTREETKEKLDKIRSKNWENPAFRRMHSIKMTKINNELWANKDFRRKRSEKVSKQMKEMWKNEDFRQKQLNMIQDLWNNIEYINKLKAKNWLSPEINKSERKLFEILNEIYPNRFKFVGDLSVIIKMKNPDFISIDDSKIIVEHLGDYWHRNDTEEILEKRANVFKLEGYETIFIWEKELKDKEKLKIKLKEKIDKITAYKGLDGNSTIQ